MNDTILVAYASRTGSTAGVAEEIGKTLAEGGPPSGASGGARYDGG